MDSAIAMTPQTFCFKREKFLQANFSVDGFLQDLWNVTSLDNLRDDLGMYLKLLRSAMIELINEDYADFVNLSGNLIGLDKALRSIQDELSIVLNSVKVVDESINESCQKMLITSFENQNLEEATLLIEFLTSIPSILSILEAHLSSIRAQESGCISNEKSWHRNSCVPIDSLTRATNRFNYLKYVCFQCLNTKITSIELHQRVKEAEDSLLSCLQSSFLRTFEQNDEASLSYIITIFSSLDKFSLMENLLRLQIILPAFKSIFNSSRLLTDPFDLTGLMGEAKTFIDNKLLPVIKIFQRLDTAISIDIVGSCILPELTNVLENQLSIIFSHKDPDLFHKRFKAMMEFMEHLQATSQIGEASDLLFKNNFHYMHLLSLWNLPVYFQIRYQELAGAVESCLLAPSVKLGLKNGDDDYHYFRTTAVLLAALNKCFDPSVYLEPLAHRFWKLSLQMLSRHQLSYSIILSEQFNAFETQPWIEQISSNEPSKSSRLYKHQGSSQAVTLNVEELVYLSIDFRTLAHSLPNLLSAVHIPCSTPEDKNCFEGALLAYKDFYEQSLMADIERLVVCELVTNSIVHMRSVSDIPRLYRRTNKEAPTKCSSYVRAMVAILEKFYEGNVKKGDFIRSWLKLAITVISKQYSTAVASVLTSVHKTEESLKRLRKDRSSAVLPQGFSDDEKIRMQLAIDVKAFAELIQKMIAEELKEINALLDLVADHTKLSLLSE